MVCDVCEYDIDSDGGPETDSATCVTCHWSASGPHSAHAGHHHHLDTGHHWRLFRLNA